MTPPEPTVERIEASLAGLEFQLEESTDGIACLAVEPAALHAVLERLRDDAAFETLTMITAIDHYGSRKPEPRFEVVHQLHSISNADRVRIKTRVASDEARVPTCTDLWPGASFMERECWDLLGVDFEGHPNQKRLLMPEGYTHHPLQKDFPHQGIEPDRLYREWDRERRKNWNPSGVKSGKVTR